MTDISIPVIFEFVLGELQALLQNLHARHLHDGEIEHARHGYACEQQHDGRADGLCAASGYGHHATGGEQEGRHVFHHLPQAEVDEAVGLRLPCQQP